MIAQALPVVNSFLHDQQRAIIIAMQAIKSERRKAISFRSRTRVKQEVPTDELGSTKSLYEVYEGNKLSL